MDVVFATYTAQVLTPDGGRHTVIDGQIWAAGDPVVAAAPPGLFTRDARKVARYTVTPPAREDDPLVEQATAAPGERRNVSRRRA